MSLIQSLLVLFWLLCIAMCKPSLMTSDKNQAVDGYEIIKIDSIDHVYLIYAVRDNKTFKVVSLKIEEKVCNRISLNHRYNLTLESLIPRQAFGADFSLVIPNIDGFEYHGVIVPIERDSVNYLYDSPNLSGLCYKEK